MMNKLRSPKSDIILNTLSPLDPKVQRYLLLANQIERLLNNAKSDYDACVPIELISEFFVLQEELYQSSKDKHQKGAN